MSSGSRGGAAVEIPASTKKVVQDLKEVVGNSEEEIYAMLKECDMDPNETAQRLLIQDPFHEVKRKRDRKKDSGALKEGAELRGRPGSGGKFERGGRGGGGGGRGISLPRFGSQERGGGRGRLLGREDGIHLSSRGSDAIPNSNSAHSEANSSVSPSKSLRPSVASQPAAAPQAQSPTTGSKRLSGVANGGSVYLRPAPAPQGAWASGHSTMADILKAQSAPPPCFQAPSAVLPSDGFPATQASVNPLYPAATPSVESSDASEFHSSSIDPVLHSSVDLCSGGAHGGIGMVGNQRPIGDWPVSTSSGEMSLGSGAAVAQPVSAEPYAVPAAGAAAVESRDAEVKVSATRSASPVSVVSPVCSQDLSAEEARASTDGVSAQVQQAGGRSPLGRNQYNGQPFYAPPLLPVGMQTGGVGLEWKAKRPGQNSVGASLDGGSQAVGAVNPTMIVQSYQALSMQDDEPVIIPTHFRVPEADRSHLSFGSFGSDFSTGFGTSFGLEEVEKTKHVQAIVADQDRVEQAAPASVEAQAEMMQSYGHQQGSTVVNNMSESVEAATLSHQSPAVAAQEQQLKPDSVVQQNPAYILGVSNYSGFGLMPQMPGSQYGYEQAELQGQDVSHAPSMVPAYDPTSSYYTSAFRGVDADRVYPAYASTTTSSKYGGNMGLMTAPSLPSSQEGVNPILVSGKPTAAPNSQAGSNALSAQVVPQQGLQQLPIHFTQPPSGQFGNFVGYQYVPQNYPYLQHPYPHHIYNSSNSAYAQVPAGSSYPLTAGLSYPSGGITAVKYPVPQYKPVAGAGNTPQSAPGTGYAGYMTPSGYGSNAAVTTGNASGYEDVNTSHYKDSTLYIPGQQQGDSSTVWIQTSMPRDMGPSGAMQTSSYYNLASQAQISGYAQHSQQPTHGHAHPNAAYANLYHPSQAGPAASHQMLQQPQGMGGGTGNTQAGVFQQQPQRTQQAWNNSNY